MLPLPAFIGRAIEQAFGASAVNRVFDDALDAGRELMRGKHPHLGECQPLAPRECPATITAAPIARSGG